MLCRLIALLLTLWVSPLLAEPPAESSASELGSEQDDEPSDAALAESDLAAEDAAAAASGAVSASSPNTVAPWAWPRAKPLPARRPIDSQHLHKDSEAERVESAERALARHDFIGAQTALGGCSGAAAALIEGRVALAQSNLPAADVALTRAEQEPGLAPWVKLERARLALAQNDALRAQDGLEPLFFSGRALAHQALLPLAAAWAQTAPGRLVAAEEEFLRRASRREPHTRGRLLGWLAVAESRLEDGAAAEAVLVRRFIEEAASSETPTVPPPGAHLDAEAYVRRAERLLEAHRNNLAEQALALADSQFPPATLPTALRCRRLFAGGLLARKQHRYRQSESTLQELLATCEEPELVRKASFLVAKVISIQDGLRALGPISSLVERYPNDSMADDALFWAADSLQRHGRLVEAESYLARILAMPAPGDQCGEAGFRMATIAQSRGDSRAAKKALVTLLGGPCTLERRDWARAQFWLARIERQTGHKKASLARLNTIVASAPLTFYGQAAQHLLGSRPPSATPPLRQTPKGLCPEALGAQPALADALMLLRLGLKTDAARELESLPALRVRHGGVQRCGTAQAALLVAELLSLADAPRLAHSHLLRDFSQTLSRPPSAETWPVWRATYPLAFRDVIAEAEAASHLPHLLLQALAREESSFDPHILSWAEAWGLTQLMYPTALGVARRTPLATPLTQPEQLTDPALNTRLGGALMRHNLDRLSHQIAPALAAYNGGLTFARHWAAREAGHDTLEAIERIGIRETRDYVKRVTETWGIYQQLYGTSRASAWLPPTLVRAPFAKGPGNKAAKPRRQRHRPHR